MKRSWLTRVTASMAAVLLGGGLLFLSGCDECDECAVESDCPTEVCPAEDVVYSTGTRVMPSESETSIRTERTREIQSESVRSDIDRDQRSDIERRDSGVRSDIKPDVDAGVRTDVQVDSSGAKLDSSAGSTSGGDSRY